MIESIHRSNRFKKDVAKLKKQDYDMQLLKEIIGLLAAEKSLPERCKNHKLHGEFTGCYDCHIQPDWVLIYEYIENTLYLYRTGSHSEIFK